VTNVLGVPALELRHPVALGILPQPDDHAVHRVEGYFHAGVASALQRRAEAPVQHEQGCRPKVGAAPLLGIWFAIHVMKTILNVLWLVLAGFWLALAYLVAAVLLAITIIGLPFAKQSLKLCVYAVWPFGRALVQSPRRSKSLSVIGNILWFVLAGWWLALSHLITGVVLCLTIIGIPLGIGDIKMAGAALVPFGREIVRVSELNVGVASASSTIVFPD